MSIGYIAERTRSGSVRSEHFRSEVSQSCDNSKPASSHAPLCCNRRGRHRVLKRVVVGRRCRLKERSVTNVELEHM